MSIKRKSHDMMKEYSCPELYQTNLMKFSYILGGKMLQI